MHSNSKLTTLLTASLTVVSVLQSVATEASAAYISGVTATADSALSAAFDPQNVVNGVGMDDAGAGLQSALHTNGNATTGWISAIGALSDVTFDVDLGSTFVLDEVAVWNFTQSFDGGQNRGSKDVTISTSIDGVTFVAIADINGGTIGTHTLTQAPNVHPGNVPQAVSDIFDLGGVSASHVRIFIHNAYGTGTGNDVVLGLNEVRFYDVPEPGSLALLGIGGIAMLRRRRSS